MRVGNLPLACSSYGHFRAARNCASFALLSDNFAQLKTEDSLCTSAANFSANKAHWLAHFVFISQTLGLFFEHFWPREGNELAHARLAAPKRVRVRPFLLVWLLFFSGWPAARQEQKQQLKLKGRRSWPGGKHDDLLMGAAQ